MEPRAVIRAVVTTAVLATALVVTAATPPAYAGVEPTITRLGGADRYATSVLVSQHHHPSGTNVVVVASGVAFPDGLAGAGLAGRNGAPLLLTRPDALPTVVRNEIIRLDPDGIILLGGTSAVSNTVFNALDDIAPTTRIAGANRYDTAVAISQAEFDPGEPTRVVVATGIDFADALAGSPLAMIGDGPLLLTRPDALPTAVRNEIIRLDPDEIILLGGTAAVSNAVFNALDDIAPTTRLAGANRYDTAVEVSEYGFGSSDEVFVAVGTNFPDSLSGAAAASGLGSPILLTRTDSLPASTRADALRLDVDEVIILGGTAVVGLVPEHRLAFLDLPDLADIDIDTVQVTTGFDDPVMITSRPGDDRLFVVEQPGRVWSMKSDGSDKVEVLDIRTDVRDNGTEQGLFAVAFDPAQPSRMIVHYTGEPDGDTVVEEYDFPLLDAAADPTPVQTILTTDQPYTNHNGGMIAFGSDGYLYVALGDGGSGGDPHGHGQNPSTLLGSILRLDLSSDPYAIPAGNPFAGGGGADEVWAYGLRNPWRFSFDGTDLYIGDVGQGRREEIDLLTTASGGANLGWNIREGTLCYPNHLGTCSSAGLTPPIHEYSIFESSRCAVTGGHVYRGAEFPDLDGAYFFGDHCTGELMALRTYKGVTVDSRVFPTTISQLSSFGVDNDQNLYGISRGGTVYRIEQSS